ncbi:hypothetical protein Ciccas_001695 [Cichlidogyrus casuarinus]|uniref:Uncharacterized protein n=1 Tax=Cichlidogyrus casuarinus TaxID=1844966 RepID=A0ABD2QMF9_9PLAT
MDEKMAKQAAKEEEGKLPPDQMFLHETDQYSKWDERGIPTHDVNGEGLPKSKSKKLVKMYEAQAKKHQAYKKMKETV